MSGADKQRQLARHLAALACNEGAAEGEAANAARALARLVHENPEDWLSAPAPPPGPLPGTSHPWDPIVGAVVREGLGFADIWIRDMLRERLAREERRAAAAAKNRAPVKAQATAAARPAKKAAPPRSRHRTIAR